MARRKKPYTKPVLILDTVLTLVTGGFWLFLVAFREVWYRI